MMMNTRTGPDESTLLGVSTNDGVVGGVDQGDDDRANGAKSKNEGLTEQILSIAIPALVALSVDPLMSAVDTAYIGRLSADHPGGGEVRVCVRVFFCVYCHPINSGRQSQHVVGIQ